MSAENNNEIIYRQSLKDYYSKKISPILLFIPFIFGILLVEYLQPFNFIKEFKLSMIILFFDILLIITMMVIFIRSKRFFISKRFIIYSDAIQIPNITQNFNTNEIKLNNIIKTEIHSTPSNPSWLIGILFAVRIGDVKNKNKIRKEIKSYEYKFTVPDLNDNEFLIFIDSEDISESDFINLLKTLLDKNLINMETYSVAKKIKKSKPIYW